MESFSSFSRLSSQIFLAWKELQTVTYYNKFAVQIFGEEEREKSSELFFSVLLGSELQELLH